MTYENFPAVIVVPNPWDGCPEGKKSMCKICNPLCSKLWIELIGPAIGRGLQQIDWIQSICSFVNSPAESGGDSLLKMIGMVFISLRGVNCPNCTKGGGRWYFLGGRGRCWCKGESLQILDFQRLASATYLWTKLVVPSMGSIIHVGLFVRLQLPPALTVSSPMKLPT